MPSPSPLSPRTSGIALIVSTLFSMLVMAHHPSVGAPDVATALREMQDLAGLSGWVHGILITLMLVNLCLLVEFCLQRGMERPLVRAGLVFYCAGVAAMIGAATVSGWITPHIAGFVPAPTEQDLHTLGLLIQFSGTVNHSLAVVATVVMSAGIFLWSVGLLHRPGAPRLSAALGLLVGIAPALGLVFGGLHLNVHGMLAVVIAQGLWLISLGVLMITGRVAP